MSVSWEEASHCPRCGEAGNELQTRPIPTGRLRGGLVHILRCENQRCRWFNTNWMVSVGPNGEIPINNSGVKEYPALDPFQEAMARRQMEQLALNDPALRRELDQFDQDKSGT